MSVVPILGFYTNKLATYQLSYGGYIAVNGGRDGSLGGGPVRSPIQQHGTPFQVAPDYASDYAAAAEVMNYSVFRDISIAERSAGISLYRGLAFRSYAVEGLTNLKCYVAAPTVGTFQVQLATMTNGYSTPLANETTSPGGSFTAPSSGSPLTVAASLADGAHTELWLQWVIPSSAAAKGWQQMQLIFTADDYDPKTFNIFHNLLSGTTLTGVGTGDSEKGYQGSGETFTITTSAAVPDNLVYVEIVGGGPSLPFGQPLGGQIVQRLLDQCTYVSSTSQTYTWRPPAPGFYSLRFFTAESNWLVKRYVQA